MGLSPFALWYLFARLTIKMLTHFAKAELLLIKRYAFNPCFSPLFGLFSHYGDARL
ncbi:hypothetical protein HBZS_109750 [Helicobacter bizzozeronii CCUG 35545]|nr:hypothetical protein HBZS_109750 [Helicobacter bizzozeronii CCUG 35545]